MNNSSSVKGPLFCTTAEQLFPEEIQKLLFFCSGCVASMWHLNMLGFIQSEANVFRHTTHCGLSSLPTLVLVKPKRRRAISHFLVFVLALFSCLVEPSP